MASDDDIPGIFDSPDELSRPEGERAPARSLGELFGIEVEEDTGGFLAAPNSLDKRYPAARLEESERPRPAETETLAPWTPPAGNPFDDFTPVDETVPVAEQPKAKKEKAPKEPRAPKEPKPERAPRQRKAKPAADPYASPKERGGPSRNMIAAAVVALGLLVGGVVIFGGGEKDPAPKPTAAAPVSALPAITVTDSTTQNPPGFATTELSVQTVPDTSVVAPTEHGVVVVNGKKVGVYRSGVRVSPVMTGDASVDFVLSTAINGRDVLVWRAGDVLNIWDPAAPAAQPTKISMTPGTTVSSAGTNLLFHVGDQTSTTDGATFTPVTKPARAGTAEPMSFDGTTVIASDAKGFVWKLGVGAAAGTAEQLNLEAPGAGLKLSKWVTAGHGHVVSLWRKTGDANATVVVHSSETGKIESKHVVDAGSVANESWIRGQGFKLAAFGGLLYDMKTGKVVLDGIKQGIVFTRPLGDVPVGSDSKGDLIFEYDKNSATASHSTVNLIGLDENGNAVVQPDAATLKFYASPL
jgi:outer membrane biosynthesis protein TonB